MDTEYQPLSMYKFRFVFRKYFNLKFKPPASDTCNRCDLLNNEIKNSLTWPTKKYRLIDAKNKHLNTVKYVKAEYKNNMKMSRNTDSKTIVLVFDLQKQLETPKLSTNISYYKRKLCVYNLCIHTII